MRAAGTESLRERAERYTPTQRRTVAAALELFGDYGVSGTSLQMIADAIGVTKAAVYHQFRTKEAIVVAALEVELAPLEEALEGARGGGAKEREALLDRVVDAAVDQRRAIGTMLSDPVLVKLLDAHEPSRQLWGRLYSVLLGDHLDGPGRVRAAVLASAIGAAGHPFVVDVDDETLRTELRRLAGRLGSRG